MNCLLRMNRLETRDDGRDHGALVVVVVVVVVIVQVLQQRSAGDAEVLQVMSLLPAAGRSK